MRPARPIAHESPSPEYWITTRSGSARETPVQMSEARPCGELTAWTLRTAMIGPPQPTPGVMITRSWMSSSWITSARIWVNEPWPQPGHQVVSSPVMTSVEGLIRVASTPAGGL